MDRGLRIRDSSIPASLALSGNFRTGAGNPLLPALAGSTEDDPARSATTEAPQVFQTIEAVRPGFAASSADSGPRHPAADPLQVP